ncbi:9785_t:CDS:2, partial [Gigaspora rosea]
DYPFDDNTYNQFNDIWKYWEFVGPITKELGKVACRLYGICVNAAAVECLWSCIGFLQTDRRSRLASPKAFDISKLRAEIKWSYRQESKSTKLPLPKTTGENDKPSNEIEPESKARHEPESEDIENE